MSTMYAVVDALLTACWYMHETEHVSDLCHELRARVMGRPIKWTDDGNKIFSVLTLLYGDYGVNPESGWITEYNKVELLQAINDYERTLYDQEEEHE